MDYRLTREIADERHNVTLAPICVERVACVPVLSNGFSNDFTCSNLSSASISRLWRVDQSME